MITAPSEADAAAIKAVAQDTAMFNARELEAFAAFVAETLAEPVRINWFVAKDADGRIVGAVVLHEELMGDRVSNLLFIGVMPSARRQGHASALLAAVEGVARAERQRLIVIETTSGPAQAPARAFYAAAGYEQEGRVRDFFADGHHKIIYRKLL